MRDHVAIIQSADGAAAVAEKLSLSVHTVRSWLHRGRIPAHYWPRLVEIGAASADELVATAPPRKSRVG